MLTGFLDTARALGVDAHEVATSNGVPVTALVNPRMLIPAAAMSAMFEDAARLAGREDFAILVIEARGSQNLGDLAVAAAEQPTLRRNVELFVRFSSLQNESMAVAIEESAKICAIRIHLAHWAGRQMSDHVLVLALAGLRRLLGSDWQPIAVGYPFPAPLDPGRHKQACGLDLQYNEDGLRIYLEQRELDARIPGRDSEIARKIVLDYERAAAERATTLVDRVRTHIALTLSEGSFSASLIAKRLAMDRRTLHRKLAAEGSNFSQIVDLVRADLVQSLIAAGIMRSDTICYRLGFRTNSALSHWFRRRFGCSISKFRNRHPKRC